MQSEYERSVSCDRLQREPPSKNTIVKKRKSHANPSSQASRLLTKERKEKVGVIAPSASNATKSFADDRRPVVWAHWRGGRRSASLPICTTRRSPPAVRPAVRPVMIRPRRLELEVVDITMFSAPEPHRPYRPPSSQHCHYARKVQIDKEDGACDAEGCL